jgi:hypothetical protein
MLFISMGRDYVPEMRPLSGLFYPQMTYENGEPRWNDSDRAKHKNSEKNLFQCRLQIKCGYYFAC